MPLGTSFITHDDEVTCFIPKHNKFWGQYE